MTDRSRLDAHVLAEQALARFGMPGAGRRLLLNEDNAVFQVSRGDERLVLRVGSENGYSPQEVRSELSWLDALLTIPSIRTPRPLKAVDGSELVLVPDARGRVRTCVMFSWINGRRPLRSLQVREAHSYGELMARLHEHALAFTPPSWFVRRPWTIDRLFGSDAGWRSARGLTEDQRRVIERVGAVVDSEISRAPASVRQRALIHSDLHLGNIVLERRRAAAIDFDDCGEGFLMFDIATTLSSLLRLLGVDRYESLRTAFLNGYASIRTLDPAMLDQDAVFFVMRDMVIVEFVATSIRPSVVQWGPQRVAGIVANIERFLALGTYPGSRGARSISR